MDEKTLAAFETVAKWADDNGYEIFGEQVWFIRDKFVTDKEYVNDN